MNEQKIQQLDTESFNRIAVAFARLQMLGDKKIATGADDNTAVEKESIITFLATELLAHCGEFLGAWSLCNQEYLPLLRSLQAVARRAGYQPTPAPAPAPHNPANN